MVGSIHDQILAHDSQTDEAEVTTGNGLRGWADTNASQARSKVSMIYRSM